MNNQLLLLLPVVLPVVLGVLLRAFKLEDRKKRQIFVAAAVILNCIITVALLLLQHGSELRFAQISEILMFALKIDKVSVVFASLVSILWVLTTFYAFGYMVHEGNELKFFSWFLISLGVAVGLAFAGNAITLYLFYELLTIVTFPMIIHSGTPEAVAAGKKYLIYSFIGASLAFISIAVLMSNSAMANFTLGGTIIGANAAANSTMLQIAYILGFLGFGVKAAVVPMHGWLPGAYVAPAPVTALLHAVAVVKAGVFAILRLTYFGYGADFLKGTWVQYVVLAMALATILYGSTKAFLTRHLKKRLAYSTVSQLSYILLAILLMTPEGMHAGLIYMLFHALIKITLFFCCGSIMFKLDLTDVHSMDGIGRPLRLTMICYMIASIALVGIPPTVGVVGKWHLVSAAFGSGGMLIGTVATSVIIISTLLTAFYLLPLAFKAFLPGRDFTLYSKAVDDAPNSMTVPIIIITIAIVVLGLFPNVVITYITGIGV